MKRALAGATQHPAAKRHCRPGDDVGVQLSAGTSVDGGAECSWTSDPHHSHTALLLSRQQPSLQLQHQPEWGKQLQWQCGGSSPKGQAAYANMLEHLLERVLSDADCALQLTSNAMCLATHICSRGASDAADAALHVADQALATTMHQLAVAQALVAHKAQQQRQQQEQQQEQQEFCMGPVDEELLDTCSSALTAGCC